MLEATGLVIEQFTSAVGQAEAALSARIGSSGDEGGAAILAAVGAKIDEMRDETRTKLHRLQGLLQQHEGLIDLMLSTSSSDDEFDQPGQNWH